MRVKRLVKQAGGSENSGRGRDHAMERREDGVPVSLVQVGGGRRGSKLRGVKGNNHLEMIRASGGQGGIRGGECWQKVLVSEGGVKNRWSR